MSATVACPHPQRCGGARSHRATSAAARWCAQGGQPPPTLWPSPASGALTPPQPGPVRALALAEAGVPVFEAVDAISVQRQVRALVETDPGSGWTSGCGQPHPSGGYAVREVWGEGSKTVMSHVDADGEHHREDGPAVVRWSPVGALEYAAWFRDGKLHRGDGPAVIVAGGDGEPSQASFFHRDHAGGHFPILLGDDTETSSTLSRWAGLVEEGHSPASAMGWVRLTAKAGRHVVSDLAASGGDGELAIAAWAAGVRGGDLEAVARGELALAWAVAGLV